ncbi:hypothetical protein [Umezawaea sp. Da 62-37]|uniref:hypothetical protein n=1 Tax=Umezawaea sp. Da 62-37 TaxID=3075927 RepID=UPI0028F6C80C|nr:hypothetical protein [Umezawaea sp. Da 62-37]WNV89250.1 hypothetical protein RM788_13375 [Umezawaea sp. Da 62-37]
MAEPRPSASSPAPDPSRRRPAVVTGLVVLLAVYTSARSLIGVIDWVDRARGGVDLADPALLSAIVTVLAGVVALAGLLGAWSTRRWGPRLYAAATVTSLLGAVFLHQAVTVPAVAGAVIAIGFWRYAETTW